MIKLSVNGIKTVEKAIAKFGEDAIMVVEDAVFENATIIEDTAKSNVPVDMGTLRQSILYTKNTPLDYNVGTSLPYAPYMEFGTGVQVKVPKEFEADAQRARGQNKGTFQEGLQAIREWLKRKGGDPKMAYVVFRSILKNGLRPRPFMYPAYIAGKKGFKKQIKLGLNGLEKKFNNG